MNQTTVKKRVVGVDISFEDTTFAIVDVRGNILAKDSFPTQNYTDINTFVNTLAERIVGLVELNGGYETVRSVGISAHSANFLTGSIVNAANMPWKGVVPLAAMLRDQLGLAVAVANNSHVVALGEQAFGSAHGLRDFIAITIGSGLGSCIFSDGEVNLGFDGYAGEIGHTCVVLNGRQCGCGNRGCLEAYTAAKGILQTAREMMEESDEASLMRSIENLSPKKIYECCEQGDEMAIEVFRRTGEILGLGLANYASLVNPEAIIFTGGIARAGHWLLDPTKKSFEEHVFHNIQDKVKFLISELGESERNVLGASVLAWKVKEYSLFK
ncbi:MAG: ROK family protein [Bacteroidaceae bacterium]|nr:ROK family protein [Bacteroidaceae bacterium]